MKRFLITVAISSVLILGIWVVPAVTMEREPQQIEQAEAANRFEIKQGVILQDSDPIVELEEMPVSSIPPKKPMDWQAFITWVIGSVNGMFGLYIMGKKVFSNKG